MTFKFQDGTELILDEGVDVTKFLANRGAPQAKEVEKLFKKYGYNLDTIPGNFLKMFTVDAKELHELSLVLEEIANLSEKYNLDLKSIFEANLRVQIFKRVFLERIKDCLEKGIPFVNSDNTFVKDLTRPTSFADYTEAMPKANKKEAEIENINLDEEDTAVKYEIIKELGKISENSQDSTLTFIISSIISNLDEAIFKAHKSYRFMGTRHIVEDALQGVVLDANMQEVFDKQVLVNFPIQENVERGI